MDLKLAKGIRVDRSGDDYILELDPLFNSVGLKDIDPDKIFAGVGLKIIRVGDALSVQFTEKTITPERLITKEMVEKSIEKKGLSYKATDNYVSAESPVKLKATKQKTRDSYRPTAAQLELINEMALEPQTEDSGYVFELLSSSTEMDRSYEQMDNKAINDMVKMTPGKPFFLDHNWNTKSIMGRMLKAKNEGGKLIQWAYVPETAKTKEFIEDLLNGNINRLSIGFSVDYNDMICNSCEKAIWDYECEHYPGGTDEKGNLVTVTIKRVKDYLETSGVGVPCLPGAGMRKSQEYADALQKAFDESYNDPKSAGKILTLGSTNDPTQVIGADYITITNGSPFQPTVVIDEKHLLTSEKTAEKVKELLGSPSSKGASGTGGTIIIECNDKGVNIKSGVSSVLRTVGSREKSAPSTIDSVNTIQDSDPVMEDNQVPEVEVQEEVVDATEAPAAVVETVVTEPEAAPAEKEVSTPAQTKAEVPAEVSEALVKLAAALEALSSKVEALDGKIESAKSESPMTIKQAMRNEETAETEAKAEVHWLNEKYGFGVGLEDQE